MFFSVVSLPFVVQKSADFVFKLLPVREIELIPADEKLIGNILCCVFDHEFVLVCAKYNADRFSVTLGIHLLSVVIKIQVHLTDIFVLHLSAFQIYQNKTLQYPMVKHEVNFKYPSANIDSLLPSYNPSLTVLHQKNSV